MAHKRLIASFAALLLLPGCLAVERNLSEQTRIGGHWASVALFDAKERVLTPSERAQVAKQDLDVIALSGGGADGAFGAGFMTGWSESGRRPKFDIVTGVSTGALMSTFVFLGPSYDKRLEELYTTIRTSDVYSTRGLEGFMADSLHDMTPLKIKIAQFVTPEMLDAIAAEHHKGRRLYVATTNLDSGTVTVWNMGAIAASDQPDRVDIYRDVLRASSSVPGFFKPVMIQPAGATDGAQMHVDGVIKAPVLLRTFMLAGPYKRKNVYILVNGSMKLRNASAPVPASLQGIAKKSIVELMRGLSYKTIYQIYVTAQRSGTNFNLTYVPDDVPETRDPLEFVPEEMRALFEAGRSYARSGKAWQQEPPRLETFERVQPVSRRAPPMATAPARPKSVSTTGSARVELAADPN